MGVDGWSAARCPTRWRVVLAPHGRVVLRGAGLLGAPTALRPPRGLPARSPSAPRASLGASSRSPARPRRPRGGLQSVGGVCVLPGQALLPPTGAAARPSGALHTCGAWSLMCALRVGSLSGQTLPLPVGVTGVSRVEFLGRSGVCCYKRRQSKVFFVWISDPLLQTSSI